MSFCTLRAALSEAQLSIVFDAVNFYKKIVPVVKNGESRVEQKLLTNSYNHPDGYQVFRRQNAEMVLFVVHTFESGPPELSLALDRPMTIEECFCQPGLDVHIESDTLKIKGLHDFNGIAILLRQEQTMDDGELKLNILAN